MLLLLFCSFMVLKGQEINKSLSAYKPVDLEDAIHHLEKIHPDSIKQKIRAMTEKDFTTNMHQTLGIWIRNNWDLWKGGSLSRYFNSLNIFHPDDMSGIILTCYYRQLQGKEWEVEKQLKYYQDYWEAMKKKMQQTDSTRIPADTKKGTAGPFSKR